MVRHSVNSLKTKIWLATGALALFVGVFVIGSWLIISLFTENSFAMVLFRCLVSVTAILVYGWWLANEVVRPIDKVALLAKSLERGTTASLPSTSGSMETDELLQTLHRNHQQVQNLVGLMDKVSSGNLDVALTPLQHSDRLSTSFQKLLAKVTESINAKRDLDRLNAAVRQLSEEVSQVKDGNFDVQIESNFKQTKEISDTLKFLLNRLNELIYQVKDDSKQSQITAKEIKKKIQVIVVADENRVREMSQATIALKQVPQTVKKISEELFASSHSAHQSIERARNGSKKAEDNVSTINQIRQQIRETIKRVGRLGERSQEIGKAAKTIEDLAQRTNLIAINASLKAAEEVGKNRGFTTFAEEVERLAERAAATNKQISTLNKTVAAEIGEIERSLQDSISEAANLSRFTIETGNSLSELEKYISQFLNLQEKLVAYSGEQTADTQAAFESFVGSIAETETTVKNLKESDTQLAQIAVAMESLQLAVADFKIPQSVVPKNAVEREMPADFETEAYNLEKL